MSIWCFIICFKFQIDNPEENHTRDGAVWDPPIRGSICPLVCQLQVDTLNLYSDNIPTGTSKTFNKNPVESLRGLVSYS